MVQAKPASLDDKPQIKMTPRGVGVDPLVRRGNGPDAKTGTFVTLARFDRPHAIGGQAQPDRMFHQAPGADQEGPPRGPHQVGQGAGVHVVGMLVGGENQVDVHLAEQAGRDGAGGHADVRLVGALILSRQVLGKVRVDDQDSGLGLQDIAALANPPDQEPPRGRVTLEDFVPKVRTHAGGLNQIRHVGSRAVGSGRSARTQRIGNRRSARETRLQSENGFPVCLQTGPNGASSRSDFRATEARVVYSGRSGTFDPRLHARGSGSSGVFASEP